jgi:hypothetical protein
MKRHAFLSMTVVLGLGLLLGLVVAGSPSSLVSLAAPAGITRHVIPGGLSTGNCDDVNWANACELQHALDVAVAGDEIWVATGVYTPAIGTDRSATFQLAGGVAVYGGFAATETLRIQRDWQTNNTILSGDLLSDDLPGFINYGDNSYNVVTGSGVTGTAVLDGFTISGGNAEGTSYAGGGMLNVGGSPTLRNLTFSRNQATHHGGGMYNYDHSSPTLTNCQFTNNVANSDNSGAGDGGGMNNDHGSNPVLSGTDFYSNTARYGGGMENQAGSSPELTNVTFSGNSATEHGGGMYNHDNSNPTLTNCQFTNNVANSDNSGDGDGGGMYNELNSSPVVSGTHFYTNTANYGGGMRNGNGSSPELTDVTFSGNTATADGGGMRNEDSSSPVLTNVTFSGNHAWAGGGMHNEGNSSPVLSGTHFLANYAWWGGGMHNGNGSNPRLTNVTFSGNSARGGDGGGMHNDPSSSPELTNVTFISNTATVDGGGMANRENSNPTLTNVTFSGNSADRYGGGMYNYSSSPALRNCILWGNTAMSDGDQIWDASSTPVVSYSLVQGGYTGSGNIDADPRFVDAASGDLHLRLDSPAVDRGNNADVTVTTDLDGNPRIGNGRVDMGAYEFQYPAPPSPIYVDGDATGARDGSDWPDALTSLRFALAWAGVGVTEYGQPAPEIWVAQGTYKPDPGADREATFQLHSGVAVYGGFAATETLRIQRDWQTNVTTLSGDLLGNDGADFANYDENSYHVVTGSGTDASAVLDGFTITGGNANGSWSFPCGRKCGGGMHNSGNPTLANVTFISNTATYHGGGMSNFSGRATLTNVTFSSNAATSGGGMYNGGLLWSYPTLISVTFSSNAATSGGGMYNQASRGPLGWLDLELTDVKFSGNTAGTGGGMFIGADSNPYLTNVAFVGNTATYHGGGMFIEDGARMTNVAFRSNVAGEAGGAMYNQDSSSLSLRSVDVISNTAAKGGGVYNNGCGLWGNGLTVISNTADYGGGMYNSNSPTVTQVTLISNTADYGGGMYNDGGSPTLVEITLLGNSADSGGGVYNFNSSPRLSYFTLSGNAADGHGGGMYNDGSDPTLVIGVLTGNRADADYDSSGKGGGIYNGGSSPDLINVTLSGNSAEDGGGMANLGDMASSLPLLKNTIVWGNTAAGGDDQIHDEGASYAQGFSCMVEGGYSGCFVQDGASPFADADGPDNVPGTADDDLRLASTSHAIDAGDKAHLPADDADLDGDGDTAEKLPYDLARAPRCYADQDLDGIIDGEPDPCASNDVDLGAYEAGCYAWHMHYGADWLAEGQDYRLGFHHEIDDPSTITISDTLASYAAERAAGNLANAKKAYGFALDCAVTVTETNDALAGLLKVTWEQATGALLEGNEQMVTALDLTDAGGMAIEITALETAIDKYAEATDGYLLPLAGEHQGDFLAAMGISRTHQLTYTTAITQVDVQRLAAASAKKSRARLELAERLFRSGNRAGAEETLRQGKAEATVELALLEEIWAGVVEDVNYHALLRCLSDMDRLLGFLVGGDKNPLGYSPEWIPIHYRPGTDLNNYVRVNELAVQKLGEAEGHIQTAKDNSQEVHDTQLVMQERYEAIEAEYNGELDRMCGADLELCDTGAIPEQISAVDQAQLRLGRVLEQMNVLNKRVLIEVEARAKAAGIYEAQAELMNPDTSEKYSTLVEQEQEISTGWKVFKGVAGILKGVTGGGGGAKAFGKKGTIAGGLFGALGPAMDMVAGLFGPEEGPPKEEKLLEFQAWQNAQMVICDGQIADVEFEKRIKELFLEYGLLDIDYSIALENLHQELLRLNGMTTRVEYLLAEKARALAFTDLLYRDPAHRVLRDYYMELAQDSYDTGLDYTFRAGRALEYEANLTSAELVSPDPDGMFGIRNIGTLKKAREDTKTAYDDWSGDKTPHTYVTDDPYPKVLLSRALNYEDTDTATAEEQFNAYVVRNPANRYDLDDTPDGVAESLYFTFDTSVHRGNPFFDHCLFNDRIESVKMRIRGADLGKTSVTVRLGWGDINCEETECGITFIRSEEAWYTDDGYGNYLDDLRAYKVQPKQATIQAVTGDVAFPTGAENYDLATRSVANDHWALFIDGTLPANQGLNLDNVDEIELIISHKAYSSQAPMCGGPGTLRLAPSRPYRPMERVLDPGSSPLLAALGEDRGLSAGDAATSLSGDYAGTVAITSPQYMPALDMNLVLTATGDSLTGYIDADQSLHVPVVDEATGHGPAVSGSWSGEGFSLESEVFTTTLSLGLPVTRHVILHSGVISDSGEVLTGLYSETLAGLTPQPMVIYGGVELWRLPAAVGPSASFAAFPVVGTVPLTVTFSDFSTGDPDGWLWDFGDGGTSTEQNPTHTYTALGTYTVTLTVSNTLGSDAVVMPGYITVVDKARIYLPLVIRGAP